MRPEDLKTAHESYKKMLSYGYRSPVIIEHANQNDPHGLPVKQEQISARDKAKYQAGWGEDVVFGIDGSLDVIADIKTRDGNKLAKEVGTYLSPQFGPWKVPDTGEILPMAITHFAMTPVPVDIGQSSEWKELPENAQVIDAIQLSQQVTFSMAGFIPEKKPGDRPDTGDTDKNNDGVVDGQVPGKPGSAPGDSGDVDPDDDGDVDSDVGGQIPGDNGQVWAQIIAALKLSGVILPDSVNPINNPHALLAGLMTCAHHTQKADAQQVAQPDPMQQVQNQMPGQDPRMAGTKQENMFTMSQSTDNKGPNGTPNVTTNATPAAPVLPDIKTLPEYIQMSQTNQALSAELTTLKREKYNGRIDKLVETFRVTKDKADEFRKTVGTYQFSAGGSSTDFVRLDAQLEFAESLPEGAVWTADERVKQMSITEEPNGDFFKIDNTSTGGLSEADQDKLLEEMYPLPK